MTKQVVLRIISAMKHETVLRNRVKELRSRLNLRQADLAQDTGVTRQTILAIEKGRLNPSIALSLRIARVLREPVDYIFHQSNQFIIKHLMKKLKLPEYKVPMTLKDIFNTWHIFFIVNSERWFLMN